MNSDTNTQETEYCEECDLRIEICDCEEWDDDDGRNEDGMTDWEADCDTLENAYGYSEWED